MVPLTSCKKTLDILLTKNKRIFEAISILLTVLTVTLVAQKPPEAGLFLVKQLSPALCMALHVQRAYL